MGEAKFLRAFMYFTLVKGYGGVPIVDHLSEVRFLMMIKKCS